MKARHMVAAFVSVTITAIGGVLSAMPAEARTLSCGDTVTADLTLTADLTCSGTALNVAVSETGTVHVNLAGHRISGNGTGTGIGIEILPSTGAADGASLVVSGGTIRGFAVALVGPAETIPEPLANVRLDRMELRDNGSWVPAESVLRKVDVIRSRIIDSGLGGAGNEGTLTIRNSSFLRTTIGSSSQSYNYLYDNSFNGSGFSHGFEANIVATGNTFRRCDIGIDAPDVWPESQTTIEHNVFDACRIGLKLDAYAGAVSVSGNTFRNNSGDGFTFRVTGSAAWIEMKVTGNRFVRNGGNGMSGTGNPGVVITDNVTISNRGHGIDVTGVTDGGGNVARANRTAPQCIGVTCTR